MQLNGVSGYGNVNFCGSNKAEKAEIKAQKAEMRAERKADLKNELNEFGAEFKKGTGITANGNEYKKATGGKIVGGVVGALITPFSLGVGALPGILVGHLFDTFVTNRNRAAQADGEAARLDRMV